MDLVVQQIVSPRAENGTEKLLHARQGVVQFHGEIVLPFGEQIHKQSSPLSRQRLIPCRNNQDKRFC
jgi:hypothetical protein